MHFFYGRVGKRYFRFGSKGSRDAWVSADERRESVLGAKVPSHLKYRGRDYETGETMEAGPELKKPFE